jgi:DMSO/TMAO reductase YedYZ molybdopterin-dependent catalytic subunit
VTTVEQQRISLSAVPLVEATPLAALARPQMPTASHFLRNHFALPEVDSADWQLEVTGSDGRVLALSLADIKQLPATSLAVVLECAGHRRAEYDPPAHGIPWRLGAISEAVWTGARLADLLELVELGDATHLVLEGADAGAVGDSGAVTRFARAIPLEKALDEHTLLAWEMNGEALPAAHGAPLRAIVPGWYATDSVKWLTSIGTHEGSFRGHFEAVDYRLPHESGRGNRRLKALAISSLVTSHADGATVDAGLVELRGIAWGAKNSVAAVDVSIDGRPWARASLDRPRGPYARVFWRYDWHAHPGRHELRVRATDRNGHTQPHRPLWNPRGYANSAVQRLTLEVGPTAA